MAEVGTVTVKVVPDLSAFRSVAQVDVYSTIANILADHIRDPFKAGDLCTQAAEVLLEKYQILPR